MWFEQHSLWLSVAGLGSVVTFVDVVWWSIERATTTPSFLQVRPIGIMSTAIVSVSTPLH